MKTVQTIFLLSIACFLGCTSTHRLRQADYVSVNKRASKKQALVTFVDGRKIQVENLRMTSDSTYWLATNKIATAQIKEVRFSSRLKGALLGMGTGFLLGAMVGWAVEDCPKNNNFSNLGPDLFCAWRDKGALGLGIYGAVLGASVGLLRGHCAFT